MHKYQKMIAYEVCHISTIKLYLTHCSLYFYNQLHPHQMFLFSLTLEGPDTLLCKFCCCWSISVMYLGSCQTS